jgi:hypothetical protein
VPVMCTASAIRLSRPESTLAAGRTIEVLRRRSERERPSTRLTRVVAARATSVVPLLSTNPPTARKGVKTSILTSLYQLAGGLVAWVRREEGQSMAEYGILIAVIALVVVARGPIHARPS